MNPRHQPTAPLLPVVFVLVLAAFLLSGFRLNADPGPSAKGFQWLEPGNERIFSERAGKPVLYYMTADWCGPCKSLRKAVFNDPIHGAMIKERFIPVMLEDTQRKTGSLTPETFERVQRYGLKSMPTLLIACSDGTEISRQQGYQGSKKVLKWLDLGFASAQTECESKSAS